MFKRIALLLAMLFAVGSISTPAFAQEEKESGSESTTETKPAEGEGKGEGEEECD